MIHKYKDIEFKGISGVKLCESLRYSQTEMIPERAKATLQESQISIRHYRECSETTLYSDQDPKASLIARTGQLRYGFHIRPL